jgi:crotonobetainyl-CoA:carnitine CoA-transferase CaiB-like acyl-CoA transferase
LTLDLKHPDGQQIFRKLVAQADAVFNNLRGDQPAKLGLRFDQLKTVNPKIVCCSLSGFGLDGPRQAEPAYDYLMQAYAGWMSLTGSPDGPPTKSGLSVVDYAGGVIAMLGLVSGLFNAQRTGQGCEVDVSLLDTAVSMLSYVAIWALNRDYEPQRLADSAHPTLTPAQAFQTQDGYIVIFCAKEKFWQALVGILDAPELAQDPHFATFATRYQYRDQLLSRLKPYFRAQSTATWLTLLQGKVPCAPVNNLSEALQDEQVLARQMILDVEHPDFGLLKQVRTAIHVSGQSERHHPGPALGADTDRVLRDLLGFPDEVIAELRQVGVI